MNIGAIVKRITKQFLRDKRSLALLVVAPILLLSLIWLVLDGDAYDPIVAVDNVPEPIVDVLQDELQEEIVHLSKEEAESAFENDELDAFITVEDGVPSILLEGSDTTASGAVLKAVQGALASMNSMAKVEPNIDYYFGADDLNLFDQIGSVLIGFFIFFFVFILGGISFLRERTQGTLEKLLSTPIKRWEIVTGYLLGFGLFTVIQSLISVAYAVYVLDVYMAGQFWELLIVTLMLALTALTLATLLSAYANNEFQMVQFIPIVIVPQVFFSGIFNLETMAEWLQVLSKFMPLTYGAEAMQAVMIKGQGIVDILPQLGVLFGFAVVFFLLNIVALKKHRRL